MRVADVMTKPVVAVKADDQLADVLPLMIGNKVSGLPVVDDNGAVIGIMSEGDLLRRVELGTSYRKEGFWSRLFTLENDAERYRRVNGRRVRDVMTEKPAAIDVNDTLADAARLMQAFRVKRLPVVHEGQLVGMLTRADFVKTLARFLAPVYDDTIVSDDEIVTKVISEIARQGWAWTTDLHVSCQNGKVTLRGYATEAQRRACIVAAEIVDGVRSVEDLMEVSAPTPMTGP